MRRIAVWLLSTLAALTLLFSYHTSTNAPAAATAAPADSAVVQAAAEAPRTATTVRSTRSAAAASGGAASGSGVGSGADPMSDTGAGSATSSSGGTADGTFTGTAASTPYGPVQVQVTVSGGRVTSVQAIAYPYSSGRDRAINSRAIPELDQEATSSQGRSVSAVSGASYTSAAYATSLQAALDEANA